MFFNDILNSFRKENLPSGAYKKYLGVLFTVIVVLAVFVAFLITVNTVNSVRADETIRIADELLEKGEYEEAEALYKSVAGDRILGSSVQKRLAALYTRWANAYIDSDLPESEILEVLEKLIVYSPSDTDVLYVMASINKNLGNTEKAFELCGKIIGLTPEDEKAIKLYAGIMLEGGDRIGAADFYMQKYNETGDAVYLELSESLYPSSPVFNKASGVYDEYFMLGLSYVPSSYTDASVKPIPASDITIIYTLDGSVPDPAAVTSSFTDQTAAKTFIYANGIDMEYYSNGNTIIVTAVAVDRYGMVSKPSVGTFAFNISYKPVKSLTLSKTEVRLEENEQTALRVEIHPSSASNQNIIWTSSNTNFAVVDQNGFVTAVNFTDNTDEDIRTTRYATVLITATAAGDGVTATCEVTVVPARIPASTAFHYTKKFLDIDLTQYTAANSDAVAYIHMDSVDRVPFLPDGVVYKPEEAGFYSNHDAAKNEDANGEMYLMESCDLTSLGRNTVICSNYVNIELPELAYPLPQYITGMENGTVNVDGTPVDPNAAEQVGTETGMPLDGTETPSEYTGKTLLTALASIDKHPYWYLNGENHYIYLNTAGSAYIFQIFSWYHPDGTFSDYARTEFKNRTEFVSFAEAANEANQLYNTTNPTFTADDRILTLLIYKDGNVDTVVHARLARYKALTDTAVALYDDGMYEPAAPEGETPTEGEEGVEEQPTEPETPVENPEEPSEPVQPEEPENNTGYEIIDIPDEWGDPSDYNPFFGDTGSEESSEEDASADETAAEDPSADESAGEKPSDEEPTDEKPSAEESPSGEPSGEEAVVQ